MLPPLYIKICLLAQEFLAQTRQTQIKNTVVAVYSFFTAIIAVKKQLIVSLGSKVRNKKTIFSLDNNVVLKLAYSCLANHPQDTTSSRLVTNITIRNKWLEPISSNWQQ
jgi:hypothetical protein